MQRPAWGDVLDGRVAAGHAPGIVALAAYPDRVECWAAGYGDISRRIPMARDTLFRIASVTKIVTAIAAMMLVDDGLIDLDEPVGRWLPEIAGKPVVRDIYGPVTEIRPSAQEVSLRHLLSMTNGMGSFFGQTAASPLIDIMHRREVTSWTASLSSAELIDRIVDLPLMFDPGSRWLYHLGLELAGILIERVSGEPLGAFMARRIFEPLGMTDTGFAVPKGQEYRLARIYADAGPYRFHEVPDWQADRTLAPAMERGGGGLISTADDLGKIGRLLLDGGVASGRQLLSPSAIREMTRDQVSGDAKAGSPVFAGFWERHGFGLGLCVSTAPDAISAVPGRYGWWGGTGTALFGDPARNVALVSLTQRMIGRLDDSGNADAFMQAVLKS